MRPALRDAPGAFMWQVFYATGEMLTTAPGKVPDGGWLLFRRDGETCLPIDLGQAFGQAFALRIDQSGGARAGQRVGGAPGWDLARQRRADHARLDAAVVGKPARMRVAIALDQAGAFGDFERQGARVPRRLSNQGKPGFDLRLFLLEAIAVRAQPAQLGQHQES